MVLLLPISLSPGVVDDGVVALPILWPPNNDVVRRYSSAVGRMGAGDCVAIVGGPATDDDVDVNTFVMTERPGGVRIVTSGYAIPFATDVGVNLFAGTIVIERIGVFVVESTSCTIAVSVAGRAAEIF